MDDKDRQNSLWPACLQGVALTAWFGGEGSISPFPVAESHSAPSNDSKSQNENLSSPDTDTGVPHSPLFPLHLEAFQPTLSLAYPIPAFSPEEGGPKAIKFTPSPSPVLQQEL